MKDDFIYFDHAATSPLSIDVLEIINSANLNYWGNVSATHKLGINCSIELESIRNNIATIFNSHSENTLDVTVLPKALRSNNQQPCSCEE